MLSTGSGRNKLRMRGLPLSALALLVLLVTGCRSDPSTARGTAELFLDAHFVHIDLPGALEYTAGVARQKVEDADRFERRWLVTVRFADGSWRVTNYQEFGG